MLLWGLGGKGNLNHNKFWSVFRIFIVSIDGLVHWKYNMSKLLCCVRYVCAREAENHGLKSS